MSTWNMPPGVNTNMIPGNRPEDLREDAFWEQVAEDFTNWCEANEHPDWPEKIDKLMQNDEWDGILYRYIGLAREVWLKQEIHEALADEAQGHMAFDEAYENRVRDWMEAHPDATMKTFYDAQTEIMSEMKRKWNDD